MLRIVLIAAVIGGAIAILASQAQAQTARCGEHSAVVAQLWDGWGESLQSAGIGSDGSLVETFASVESGTWTVTMTAPNGPTCIVAHGEAFQWVNDPGGERA